MTFAPFNSPSVSPLRGRACAAINAAMRRNELLLLLLALAAMHQAAGASYSNSTADNADCPMPARVYYFVQSGQGVQVTSAGNGTYKLQVFQASNTTAWFMNDPYRDGGVDPTHAWLQGFAKQTSSADNPMNAALVVNTLEGQVTALIEVWDGSLSADGTLQYWARALQDDTQPFSKWPTWDDELEDIAMDMPTSLFLDGGCENAVYGCHLECSSEYQIYGYYKCQPDASCGCLNNVPMYYQNAACESCGDTGGWCDAAFGSCCSSEWSSCKGVIHAMCDADLGVYNCEGGTENGVGQCDNRNC